MFILLYILVFGSSWFLLIHDLDHVHLRLVLDSWFILVFLSHDLDCVLPLVPNS